MLTPAGPDFTKPPKSGIHIHALTVYGGVVGVEVRYRLLLLRNHILSEQRHKTFAHLLVGVARPETAVTMALSSDDSQQCSTSPVFTLFPALPAELRLKVWAFSFTPRIVEIHSRKP